jgi:DNA-binding XRE family transcriptional regulator
MVTTESNKPLILDLSEVRHREVQEQVKASLADLGCHYRTVSSFWDYFPSNSNRLAKRSVIATDLAFLARHFRKTDDRHAWIASVRKYQLYFVAFVRTKEDEQYADLVDDLVRHCDLRISVCKTFRARDVTACMHDAVSSFDPATLSSVRYSMQRQGFGVEFGDGLLGFVRWIDLGLQSFLQQLVLESATVGSRGRTLELSQKDGTLFEIDSLSIRSLLDTALRHHIQASADAALVAVGQRIREARQRSGLTQDELSGISGIDQALISKMERGQHQPRYDTMSKLATSLGMSIPELLSTSAADFGESAP